MTALGIELEVLIPLSQTFFGKLQAKFSKSKFPLVFQALTQNFLSFDTDNLRAIRLECQSKFEVKALFEDLQSSSFFKPSGQFSADLVQVEKLLNWKESWENLIEIQEMADWKRLSFWEFEESLDKIQSCAEGLSSNLISYRLWLSEAQYVEVMEKGLEQAFAENPLNWPSVFVQLKGFDQFLEGWEFRDLGEQLVRDFSGVELLEVVSAFWNGWRLAWIGEIERRHPILSEMGSLRLGYELEELKNAILEKRKNAHYLALLRLLEQVAEHLDYNRLGNRLTYR